MGSGSSSLDNNKAVTEGWQASQQQQPSHGSILHVAPTVKISIPDEHEHDTILSPDPSYITPRIIPDSSRSSKADDNISVKSLTTECDMDDEDEVMPGTVPFQPPNMKRKSLIPDINMFQLIDTASITIPKLASRTPEDLAYHLSKPAKNDLDKIRAFYVWITHNISYDIASFFSGNITTRNGAQVLADEKGVCDHYSQLFMELCRFAEVPCIKVNGFAKGYGYSPDEPFAQKGKTTHSWNLVQIDNNWWPIDCTWGSGHVSANKQFERFFQEFYFLPEPELFILSHFPKKDLAITVNNRYQLLQHHITLSEFNKSAKVEPGALYHGIKLSHKNYYFKVLKECDITLRVPVDIVRDIACHFREKKSKKCYDSYVMCEKVDDETFNIHIRPPQEARFILEIYALPWSSTTTSFDLVSEFCLRCDEESSDRKPYPNRFGIWGASPECVEYGFMEDMFDSTTFESSDGKLDLSFNLCNEVITLMQLRSAESSKDMEEYIFCSYTSSAMKISARLPHVGYYELNLFAQRPGHSAGQFDCIGHFLVRCVKELENCPPFPMYYPGAAEYNCKLHEPLKRCLPPNTEVKFKLSSSTLREVIVETTPMDKTGTNTWEGSLFTCDAEPVVRIYGSDGHGMTHQCLYEFKVAYS